MTETHTNFLLYSGDTWTFDASLHDVGGAALDLSGAAVTWRLRDAGGNIKAVLGIGTGVTITDAVNGRCKIVLPTEQSVLIAEGSYSDEIRVTLADGAVSTQAVGAITVMRAGSIATTPPNLAVSLATLKAARSSGQRRVKMENFEVEYKDDSEMVRAIAALESEIARTQGSNPIRNINLRSKGWT